MKTYIAIDGFGWSHNKDFFEAVKTRDEDSGRKLSFMYVWEAEIGVDEPFLIEMFQPQIEGARCVFSRTKDRATGELSYNFS